MSTFDGENLTRFSLRIAEKTFTNDIKCSMMYTGER